MAIREDGYLMPQAKSKRSEAEVIEAAQDQIDRIVERRSRSEKQAEIEAQWDRTQREEAAQLRLPRKHQWLTYHRRQAESIQKQAADLVEHHRRCAQELEASL